MLVRRLGVCASIYLSLGVASRLDLIPEVMTMPAQTNHRTPSAAAEYRSHALSRVPEGHLLWNVPQRLSQMRAEW